MNPLSLFNVSFVSVAPLTLRRHPNNLPLSRQQQKQLGAKRCPNHCSYVHIAMKSSGDGGKVSRRQFLHRIGLASLTCYGIAYNMVLPNVAQALTAGDAHAQLSDFVAKLPGAGMPDIYFPDYFLGTWDVSRKLVSVNTSKEFENMAHSNHSVLSQDGISLFQQAIGVPIALRMRFFTHRGHVIQDRAINAFEEISPLLAISGITEHSSDIKQIQFSPNNVEASWDPDNANVLGLSWGGSGELKRVREVKVTKRAFKDQPQGVGTFVASEYARVVDVEGEGALLGIGKPPNNYARRRVSRFTVASVSDDLSPNRVYRLVIEYLFAPNVINEKTVITLKYRDVLTRRS